MKQPMISLGKISLDDGPDTFDDDKCVEELNKQLQDPRSPAFKAFVGLIERGRRIEEREQREAIRAKLAEES